jgi:hypothetical protein
VDAKEFVKRGTDEVVAFYCGKCGKVHGSFAIAEQCCNQVLCRCGKAAVGGYVVCPKCLVEAERRVEQARFDKAEKILIDAYDGDWIFSDAFHDDGFSPTDQVEDALERMDPKDRPKYAWACKPFGLKRIDATDIIEHLLEDHHEDAWEQVDHDGLQAVLDEWIKKQSVISYEPDYSKAVLLDTALEEVAKQDAEEAQEERERDGSEMRETLKFEANLQKTIAKVRLNAKEGEKA